MLNPINHAQHAGRASTATRSSRTWSPPTSTPSRRTSAAAAGPGTPARPAGCTAPALESILGFRLRGTLHLDPCIPRAWPAYEITFRYRSARYAIRVENPHGATRGIAAVEVDGVPLRRRAGIALTDDGKTHQVRVVLGDASEATRETSLG